MQIQKISLMLCSATLLLLSACGVKPPHTEPPAGAKHDTFPGVYPDTRTDPQPGLEERHLGAQQP